MKVCINIVAFILKVTMLRYFFAMPEKNDTPDPKPLRSQCPIANTLDIIGDRWTLLIIRDILINGKHRFRAFQEIPEAFPTNILSDRLKRLERWDLIEKRVYQEHPVRYEYHVTEKGASLAPVLRAIETWGTHFFFGSDAPDGV